MEVEQGQANDGNGLSGVLGMSRAEFRYMIESVVGGAVHGLRAEMVVAQAALKEEIQTGLEAAVQTTHSLRSETTRKMEALEDNFASFRRRREEEHVSHRPDNSGAA